MSANFLAFRNTDALLARARTFLENIDVNPGNLNTINQLVYDINYNHAYKQACDQVGEDADHHERELTQSYIADSLVSDINEYGLEYRVAFLFQQEYSESQLETAFRKGRESTLYRAEIFLKNALFRGAKKNNETLKTLNENVFARAYEIDAHEQARKEGKQDNQMYQAILAYKVAAEVNENDIEYRIAFLLERGYSEWELETRIFREVLLDRARAILKDVDVNDDVLKILDELVHQVADDINIHEYFPEFSSQDHEALDYEAFLSDLASKTIALEPEYRVAFLLEHGIKEYELKADLSNETGPCL